MFHLSIKYLLHYITILCICKNMLFTFLLFCSQNIIKKNTGKITTMCTLTFWFLFQQKKKKLFKKCSSVFFFSWLFKSEKLCVISLIWKRYTGSQYHLKVFQKTKTQNNSEDFAYCLFTLCSWWKICFLVSQNTSLRQRYRGSFPRLSPVQPSQPSKFPFREQPA